MATPDTRCKVVVRRLPPCLQEEAFREALQQWFERTDWFCYVQGKASSKELLHSRAYLRFKDATEVPRFQQAWNDHVFVNERGTQFRCQVEYAPYQKVPRQRVKRDPKENTIERDAEYLAFVDRLKAGPEPAGLIEPPAAADGGSGAAAVIITPLMQYMKDKRAPKSSVLVLRRGAKGQAAAAGGKGKPAAAATGDKKGKAAAAAGKKGDGKQQATAAATAGKKGDGKQQATAAAAIQKGGKQASSGMAKKRAAAAASEPAAPPPSILRRPAGAAVGAAAAAAQAAQGPAASQQQQAAGKPDGGKKQPSKQQQPKQQVPKTKHALKQLKEQLQAAQLQPVLKVLTRPASRQQAEAPVVEALSASTTAGAGGSGEQAPKQRPSKPERVRAGFGTYHPKAAGRLLQQVLPQAQACGDTEDGSGHGGGTRGRGRGGRQEQQASAVALGAAYQ